MSDTVTRLMALADEYADWSMAKGNEHPTYIETRQALEAELTRLFTPLSDEQIHKLAHGDGGIDVPYLMFAREIEHRHGIGETK